MLRLSQEPYENEINDAADKYIEFIQLPYDSTDEQHVNNEKYFIKVFLALKHTRNPSILRKLLQVIKFYINQDDSPVQKEIINPHTILWMLEIMEHQRQEKYLCCLTSSTLLNIVSKHEIHFDYQEVAIIKKFNLALQNIDVFYSDIDDTLPHSAGSPQPNNTTTAKDDSKIDSKNGQEAEEGAAAGSRGEEAE